MDALMAEGICCIGLEGCIDSCRRGCQPFAGRLQFNKAFARVGKQLFCSTILKAPRRKRLDLECKKIVTFITYNNFPYG